MTGDLEHLHNALKLVSDIRSRTGKLWKTASDGTTVNHGDDGVKDKRFLSELKSLLDGVNGQIQSLETTLNSQPAISNPLPLSLIHI